MSPAVFILLGPMVFAILLAFCFIEDDVEHHDLEDDDD